MCNIVFSSRLQAQLSACDLSYKSLMKNSSDPATYVCTSDLQICLIDAIGRVCSVKPSPPSRNDRFIAKFYLLLP